MVSILPRGPRRLAAVGTTVALLAGAAMATSGTAAAAGATQYVKAKPVCHRAAAGHAACKAFRLVQVGARTAGARAMTAAAAPAATYPVGPRGGYTPGDLATAYGFDPNAAASRGNVLAIVDAFNDPNVRSDLNAFDAKYGLPAETSTSFRVVGQNGGSTLPAKDTTGWSVEEALDVESARAVCHLCSIVLVEANSTGFGDLAAAVNTAAALGAKEISNSYGGSETSVPSTVASAYDHKNVVITASTGDDGWHEWDNVNSGGVPSGTPELPSSLNTVVGVGGTALYLNADSTRASEQVWNENGPSDLTGLGWGSMGATGGGCSTTVAARNFQKGVTGYPSLGCGTQRSATDIAALADPYTGFDVVSTYNYGLGSPGWITVGGTSLASPLVAAMWALAGGAQNLDYPALTLYGHLKSAPATYDVQVGGNGACDTSNPLACKSFYAGDTPNGYWGMNVDCAFSPNDTVNTGQCYAQKGYDGPSGVGAPRGLATFTAMAPAASLSGPSTVTHGSDAVFTGTATDPFPGGSISSYSWTFGDGGVATGSTVHHTYAHAGTFTVGMKVTDAYGVASTKTKTVTVS